VKTAVEWYDAQLKEIDFKLQSGLINYEQCKELMLEAFNQAKAMEKEQIIKASAIAYEDMFGSDGTQYGQEYYNKTFKSE
jgi:hypothetical protein